MVLSRHLFFVVVRFLCCASLCATSDTEQLEKDVARWLNISSGVSLKKLSGGLTNISFVAITPDDSRPTCVVRIGKKDPSIFGINRFCEKACQERASDMGIAPKIFYSDPRNGTLVSSFIPGKNLTIKNICDSSRLQDVIDIIKKCHNIPFKKEFKTFSIYDKVRTMLYALVTGEKLFIPHKEAQEIRTIIDSIEEYFGGKEKKYEGLCHGDLVAGNFRDDGTHLWLIDWEYACWDNILMDLASFCIELHLGEEKTKEVLMLYFGQKWQEYYFDFMLMCVMYNIRDAFWYALRDREVAFIDGICMIEFAQRHLNNAKILWSYIQRDGYLFLPIPSGYDIRNSYHTLLSCWMPGGIADTSGIAFEFLP